MKGYIDFWIQSTDIESIADKAYVLGYNTVCIVDQGFSWRVRKVGNVVFVKKKVVVSDNEKSLKELLRGIKTSYPIVSVKPTGVSAARLAARDGRVDTVVLSPDTIDYIDKTQALMMKRYGKPLEVPINSFLKSNRRIKAMIYRRIYLFYQYSVPIIYSSSASEWNELIHPRGIVSLIKTLFEIDYRHVLLSISDIPRKILVGNGVRV